MRAERGCPIKTVAPGSPAAAAGIKPGERLLRLDGMPPGDIIDFKIGEADELVELLVAAPGAPVRRLRIAKEAHTPLGLGFDPPTIAPLRRCGNRCIFCFVDRNPPGLRPSLYLKDDDYRMSFVYGNFITLNNLGPRDLARITRLRLAPLYVSVHSTDPALRRRLFGTGRAVRGLENLRFLAKNGIAMHLQVVLCPGINTGEALERTIGDLGRLGPAAASIALVPVGLTVHRPSGRPALHRFDPAGARALLRQAERWRRRFLRSRGSRLVFPGDEFYVLAGRPYPPAAEYEGFPQLENGVGLARLFLDELANLAPPPSLRPVRVTLATGQAAAPLLEETAHRLRVPGQIELRLAVLENRFFGETVTVAGLLSGSDLIAGLRGRDPGEAVFISRALLKEGGGLFLDGRTRQQVQAALGVPLVAVSGPRELAAEIARLVRGPRPAAREVAGI